MSKCINSLLKHKSKILLYSYQVFSQQMLFLMHLFMHTNEHLIIYMYWYIDAVYINASILYKSLFAILTCILKCYVYIVIHQCITVLSVYSIILSLYVYVCKHLSLSIMYIKWIVHMVSFPNVVTYGKHTWLWSIA